MAFNYSRLRGLIKEHFVTQEAFADALGISHTSLSLSLNNRRPFSQYEINKAASLLKVKPEEINDIFFKE